MAGALFERLVRDHNLPGKWNIASAGTWAQDGNRASENGVILMGKWDMDISKHRSRIVRKGLLESADLVLTMENGHKEAIQAEFPEISDRVFMLSEMTGLRLDIRDPYGGALNEYQETAREIEAYLVKGFPTIMSLLSTAG